MAGKKVSSRIMSPEEIKEFHEFEAEQEAEAEGVQAQGVVGNIIRRIVRFAVNIAVIRAKQRDPDFDEDGFRAEVDAAIEAIGDGVIWDWLINGGFEQILEWIMLILSLFQGSRGSPKASKSRK